MISCLLVLKPKYYRLFASDEKKKKNEINLLDYVLNKQKLHRRGVQLAHVGNCTRLEPSTCPTSCPEEDSPLCGSDGNVYRSDCELRRQTCGQFVVPVAPHHCRNTAACVEECGNERNFVCGSDNKFYRSDCEMKKSNCGWVFQICQKRIKPHWD